MDQQRAQPPFPEAEFEAIEAAMLETARGRWFLAEFARRNRNADTEMLLGAIGRLERSLPARADPDGPGAAAGRPWPGEAGALIARTRREIAAADPRGPAPEQAFEALAAGAEAAAAAILASAAEAEDLALALRAAGAEPWLAEEVGRCAAAIRGAGARQDLAARHVGRLVRLVREIEGGLAAPEQAAPAGPAALSAEPEAPDDDLFAAPDEAEAPPAPRASGPATLPSLELLELREQLRRLS